jgi:hypothetical protein
LILKSEVVHGKLLETRHDIDLPCVCH